MSKIPVIAVALVLAAIVAVPAAAISAEKGLDAPKLLSPVNNAKLASDDLLVTLEWEPVADGSVADYLVEVEGFSEPWDLWGPFSTIPRVTTGTRYQVDCFPAGEPTSSGWLTYRWRVTARSSVPGFDSPPSQWRTFSFVRPAPTTNLAKVRIVSPDKKAIFGPGDVQSYEWELVTGAVSYYLIHERMNAENEWHIVGPTVVFGAEPVLSYVRESPSVGDFTSPGTYRWRVIALDTLGYGTDVWSVSPWRTYTVT